MATIQQIMDDVVAETRRPDLSVRIERAVKNALLRIHQSELFAADLFEGRIGSAAYSAVAPDSRFVIPLTDMTRFRLFNKLHDYDATNAIIGKEYSIEDNPNFQLNMLGSVRTRIARRAGSSIIVFAGDALGSTRSFYGSYYRDPDLTSLSGTTWITDRHPYAVMWAAVAAIHRGNGNAEQANAATADAQIEYGNILTNALNLQGR